MCRTSATAFVARTGVLALLAWVGLLYAPPVCAEESEEPGVETRDVDRVPKPRSRYASEERLFGNIEPDFRGPLEVAFYSGWKVYGNEIGLEKGGSLHGGLRFSINVGEENTFAVDLGGTMTRIAYELKSRRIENRLVTTRGEVTIATVTVGLTYRPTFLRFDVASPYFHLGMGIVNFNRTEHRGAVSPPVPVPAGFPASSGTNPDVRIGDAVGFAAELGIGLDYKLAKNWSLKVETQAELWLVDWLDGDDQLLNGGIEFGVIWHFDYGTFSD